MTRRLLVPAVRYGIPVALCLTGMIVLVVRGADTIAFEVAAMFVGAGLSILLLNVIFRLGVQGDEDRDREDAARSFFDAHGYWPDERPSRHEAVAAGGAAREPDERPSRHEAVAAGGAGREPDERPSERSSSDATADRS
jgi:hypothetical protein